MPDSLLMYACEKKCVVSHVVRAHRMGGTALNKSHGRRDVVARWHGGSMPGSAPARHPSLSVPSQAPGGNQVRPIPFRPPSACHKPPNSEPDSEPAQNASETHTLLTLTCNMYYVLRTFSQPHEPFTLYAIFTRLRVGRRVTSCDVLRSLRHQQQTKQRLGPPAK